MKRLRVIGPLFIPLVLAACSGDGALAPAEPRLSVRFESVDAGAAMLRLLLRRDGATLARWEGRPHESMDLDLAFSDSVEVLALAYDEAGHLLQSGRLFLSPEKTGALVIALGPLPSRDDFPLEGYALGFAYPYIRWSLKDFAGPFDEDGIPLNPGVSGQDGPVHHPLYVAQIALAKHAAYLRGDGDAYRDDFLFLAEHLRRIAVMRDGMAYWPNSFLANWVYIEFQAPWVSGLKQGEVIAVLVHAYELTGEESYLELARRGILAFHQTCDQPWGLGAVDHLGFHTPEEYPGEPSSHVLNGMILILFGILDYHKVTGDPHAEALYRRGVRYLTDRLHVYDTGYWSLYDAYRDEDDPGGLVPEFYHRLHIELLESLYGQTGLPVFQEYADRFRSYL